MVIMWLMVNDIRITCVMMWYGVPSVCQFMKYTY